MVVREVRAEDHGRSFSGRSMMLVDIIPKNAFGGIVEDFFREQVPEAPCENKAPLACFSESNPAPSSYRHEVVLY